MYAVFILLAFILHRSHGFACPNDNGFSVNPDDYRSYYICSNRCPELMYCVAPGIYFTRTNQTCIPEPADWRTRYNVSGQFKSTEKTDVFIRQEGYSLFISEETISTHFTAIARYINETHAIGIRTARRLTNNCIAVFDIRIVATGNQAHCFYETLRPYSSKCDLPVNYSGNYCKTY